MRTRLGPGLDELGFARRKTSFLAHPGDVVWVLDLEFASWSSPAHLTFTLAWGVHVPGLDDVLGDRVGVQSLRAWGCPVHGRLGAGPDARWWQLRRLWWPGERIGPLVDAVDARTARQVVRSAATTALPRLRRLSTPQAVQRQLVARVKDKRGPATTAELRRIRQVAALSLLAGNRENACRWLDHLEVRSSAIMAPDAVAERLAPLRQRCLVP